MPISKVVILAGGLGTRLSEETETKPKPMVEIGGRPIIWHIMKLYSHFGLNEFIICIGYKGYVIKEYFSNYFLHMSDVTLDLRSNSTEVHRANAEPWRITLIDTGADTMTGGRLLRVRDYLCDDEFCLTYGDGVSDVNIAALIDHHQKSGRLATVTAVRPPGRFGAMEIDTDSVRSFREKPLGDGNWINGGFFVMSRRVLDYIADDATSLEDEPLTNLARDGHLGAFRHSGFWQAMDTLRDRRQLEAEWASGHARWKLW